MHIYDKDFIHGELPMTKQEVRAVSIAKLQLEDDSVLIDVGAGTGTIGIEAATYIKNGKVIGIEKEEKGLEVIRENVKKFNLDNYFLIHGRAPENIPEINYDRMFIGGSTGGMREIVAHFMQYSKKNSRLVINAITLETLSSSMEILKEFGFKDIEVVNLMVGRAVSVLLWNVRKENLQERSDRMISVLQHRISRKMLLPEESAFAPFLERAISMKWKQLLVF